MAIPTQFRPTNPRLGISYATFTSAIIGFVIVLAIFEQLGINNQSLKPLIIGVPILFFVIIGGITRTVLVEDFYTSGRRVPPIYNGLALAASGIGGIGFFSFTGALYLIGFDILALALGWAAGFTLMVFLFFPYLRKFGAYSLPGFFGERFRSPALRIMTVLLLLVPSFMLLTAELGLAAKITGHFVALEPSTMLTLLAGLAVAMTLLGGIRALTWTQCAQGIVLFIGLMVPLVILTMTFSNLPVPHISYGNLLDQISSFENQSGIQNTTPMALSDAIPKPESTTMQKPFLQAFGLIGQTDFLLLVICFMAGIATLPSLLQRAGTSLGVAGARQSAAWGTLFLAFLLITFPALASFAKYLTLHDLIGKNVGDMPSWLNSLRDAQIIEAPNDNRDGILSLQEFHIPRDSVALALPFLAGYSAVVLFGLLAIAGLSAGFAAINAQLVSIASTISNDLFYSTAFPRASASKRLLVARLALIATAALAGFFVISSKLDALRMLIWAVSISAGSFFPVLLLSIWWRPITPMGALAGTWSGFLVTSGYILGVEWDYTPLIFGIDSLVAAIIGMPVSFLVTIAVSLLIPQQDEELQKDLDEQLDETRVAAGETVHDRYLRILARRQGLN